MATAVAKKNSPKIKPLDVFTWQGVNRKGKKINGELPANNVIELKAQLRKQGITPSKVKKKSKPLFGMGGDKAITQSDIAVISRQIATMLGAGVPLVQTIEMIGKGHSNGNMQKMFGEISHKLSSGIPLSDCLRDHPRHFDDLYCDLVASGEQSGSLETIYDRIATYKEKA
jgi:type IV pilus assembly protein PilC